MLAGLVPVKSNKDNACSGDSLNNGNVVKQCGWSTLDKLSFVGQEDMVAGLIWAWR